MLMFEIGYGAGDETRTRDIYHGKVVLYQLSYPRIAYYRNLAERRRFELLGPSLTRHVSNVVP